MTFWSDFDAESKDEFLCECA